MNTWWCHTMDISRHAQQPHHELPLSYLTIAFAKYNFDISKACCLSWGWGSRGCAVDSLCYPSVLEMTNKTTPPSMHSWCGHDICKYAHALKLQGNHRALGGFTCAHSDCEGLSGAVWWMCTPWEDCISSLQHIVKENFIGCWTNQQEALYLNKWARRMFCS